jgi:hypothetical protein
MQKLFWSSNIFNNCLRSDLMKKVMALFSTAIIILISITTLHAAAGDISVGATAWYATWETKWDGKDEITYDPDFLYGPVISASITSDVNIAFVFLYGGFDMSIENQEGVIKVKRYDSDLTLSYRLGSMIRVFGGAKYIGFTWPDDGKHEALGPGAGFSAVIPLGGDFFLMGNISGLYLFGKEKGQSSTGNYNTKTKEYGGNASISLSYHIPAASTTISLGGRYQYIFMDYDKTIPDTAEDSSNTFYGVTLSAVYSFSI